MQEVHTHWNDWSNWMARRSDLSMQRKSVQEVTYWMICHHHSFINNKRNTNAAILQQSGS
eukprot:11018507-Ditylum_brightwellii.AAC.1